jgi:hypothetical protein
LLEIEVRDEHVFNKTSVREELPAQANHAAMVGVQAAIYESMTKVVEIIHNFMMIAKKGNGIIGMCVEAPANPCRDSQKTTQRFLLLTNDNPMRCWWNADLDILRSRKIKRRNRGE